MEELPANSMLFWEMYCGGAGSLSVLKLFTHVLAVLGTLVCGSQMLTFCVLGAMVWRSYILTGCAGSCRVDVLHANVLLC